MAAAVIAAVAAVAFAAIAVWLYMSARAALDRFGSASAEALRRSGDELADKGAGRLKQMLEPLERQIEACRESVRAAERRNAEIETAMKTHMEGLAAAARKFDTTATSFVAAVDGGNKVQGNWGERILWSVLEACGMVEGTHFLAQSGSDGKIPDCQILDAATRRVLVVDAKSSWKSYREMCGTADAKARDAALEEHVRSVRAQIDALARKEYHKSTPPREGYEYVPLSAMFVPSDAALWTAVSHDPDIPNYAFSRGVALVTPTSLFGFLKLVMAGWAKYDVNRNADRIMDEARKLVQRIDALFASIEDVGRNLDRAKESQQTALRLASADGSGQCILGPARRIIDCGVKLDKALKSSSVNRG